MHIILSIESDCTDFYHLRNTFKTPKFIRITVPKIKKNHYQNQLISIRYIFGTTLLYENQAMKIVVCTEMSFCDYKKDKVWLLIMYNLCIIF